MSQFFYFPEFDKSFLDASDRVDRAMRDATLEATKRVDAEILRLILRGYSCSQIVMTPWRLELVGNRYEIVTSIGAHGDPINAKKVVTK